MQTMSEQEKQMLMAMIMRQSEPEGPKDLGGHMTAPEQSAPGQPQAMGIEAQQPGGGQSPPGLHQLGQKLAGMGGAAPVSGNATGAAMSNPAAFAPAAAAPTATGSMAGSTAAAELAAGSGYLAPGATPVAMSGGAAAAPAAAAPAAAGGGATSGAGGMMAAAGPWAALAAAVVANETYQTKQGRRSKHGKDIAKDLVTGKGFRRDMEHYLGEDAGKVVGLATPSGATEFLKKTHKPWEWF